MKKTLLSLAALASLTAPEMGVAQSVAYPDLKVITPTTEISIGHPTPTTRELRFSHITWNAGAGPLEIRPSFNAATGTALAFQRLYSRDASGNLVFVKDVPIAVPMRFDSPSDYRFPLSAFYLYTNANGVPGTPVPVATSPKIDFCMTEDFEVSGTTIDPGTSFAVPFSVLPNTPPSVVYSGGNCSDPNGILGLSVGWGDKYDYLDPGENIDITNVPDGVYWLRSIADPQHLLTESNPSNNITDTQIQISGNTVNVLQRKTADSTPPTITLTSPGPGASLSGVVTLTATVGSSPAVASVQFILDGLPLSSPVTVNGTTYSTSFDTTALSGSHLLTAQATASGTGFIGTATPVSVTIASTIGSLVLDQTLSVDATGGPAVTPSFSTPAGELLVALVGSDGPSASQSQSITLSGAGLAWSLVCRANTMFGTSEIWAATTASALTNVTVTSTQSANTYHQSSTVLAFHGTSGTPSVGAHGTASALQGAPAVSLTTTGSGSWVLGVGNDWDSATGRTLGLNQQLLHQWTDTSTGDTYWMQATASTIDNPSNTAVTLNDTFPTEDRWNFSAVEVRTAGPGPSPTPTPTPPPPDTTPPVVTILNPASNTMVSGSVNVIANATDNVALNAANPVIFFLDSPTNLLPGPIMANGSQFSTSWDTSRTANGTHSVGATATDSSNNKTTLTVTGILVSNPPPPVPCFILDATAAVNGRGPVTTPSFRTSLAGERLFAFAASDGPKNTSQTLSVSGGGLSWTLVKRGNAQPGTAEIWTALAPSALTSLTVSAQQTITGYDMSLYVVAYQGVGGVGNSAAASASRGAPTVKVTTTKAGSLLYAVGNDYDHAIDMSRAVGTNQILDYQWLDTATRDTYWVQNETFPPIIPLGAVITLNDTAPTRDQWNFVAVEILNDD
jgi:Bacterial Ig domain/Lysyl oxidase